MGLFDKLKKASDGFFDGMKNNAVDNALTNSKEERLKNESIEIEKLNRRENEELEKILSKVPIASISKKLSKDELEEIERVKLLEEKEKYEMNERVKLKEKEFRDKIKNELIQKYGEEIGKKLFRKELFVGMTLEMLTEIKGKYSEKVENVTNGKVKVKLFYEKSKNRLGNISYGFEVSLEDGLVVGWKDRKNKGTKEG